MAEHPKLYRAGRVAGTREMPIRQSYIAVYAENDRQVTILRILHSAQLWPR